MAGTKIKILVLKKHSNSLTKKKIKEIKIRHPRADVLFIYNVIF